MAQKSKRNYIVEIAQPLFLEHGFKATSIDLVVKQSGVSKPTVYNHFPDKSALMLAVVQQWCDKNPPGPVVIKERASFEKVIQSNWLSKEAVQFYALVIGEGRRFTEAKQIFWDSYDATWRHALIKSAKAAKLAEHFNLEQRMDQLLLNRLRSL